MSSRRIVALILLLSGSCGCSQVQSASEGALASSDAYSWIPESTNDGWEVSGASESGFDIEILDSMTASLRQDLPYPNVHAVVIARHDKLVYEAYFFGTDRRWDGEKIATVPIQFDRNTLHDSRSAGKSVTSAVVGIALDQGAIPSIDQPILDYFPELESLATPEKRVITIRHALMMSSGLNWNEDEVPYTDPANDAEQMTASENPINYLLSKPLSVSPGSEFYYNSGLPMLLGMVVARSTGEPYGAYALKMLFEPLGIEEVEWASYSNWDSIPELTWESEKPWATNTDPGGNVWMRARDFAKFGSLFLNRGRWKDKQILPEAWVRESTRRRFTLTKYGERFGDLGYGYLWWLEVHETDLGETEVFAALGNGGQRIFVVPSLDMVVVILCGGYNDPNYWSLPERILLEQIIPAIR